MYSPSCRTSFTFSIQQPVKCEKVCTSALYHKDKEESSVNEDPTNSNKLFQKTGGML